jgi:hypothetical protein
MSALMVSLPPAPYMTSSEVVPSTRSGLSVPRQGPPRASDDRGGTEGERRHGEKDPEAHHHYHDHEDDPFQAHADTSWLLRRASIANEAQGDEIAVNCARTPKVIHRAAE